MLPSFSRIIANALECNSPLSSHLIGGNYSFLRTSRIKSLHNEEAVRNSYSQNEYHGSIIQADLLLQAIKRQVGRLIDGARASSSAYWPFLPVFPLGRLISLDEDGKVRHEDGLYIHFTECMRLGVLVGLTSCVDNCIDSGHLWICYTYRFGKTYHR